MSMPKDAVEKYMTHSPHTIGVDQPLERAKEMLRNYNIRHLPVLRGGHLVGLLSSRDIDFIESLPGVDAEKVTVEDAMTQQPYSVAPETPVAEVAEQMAEHRYGSAVIARGDRVLGVFTTTDGMRLLAKMLRGGA